MIFFKSFEQRIADQIKKDADFWEKSSAFYARIAKIDDIAQQAKAIDQFREENWLAEANILEKLQYKIRRYTNLFFSKIKG